MSENIKTEYIQGTPAQVGAEVFETFCLPALKASEGRPASEIAQLYSGFLSATMGAMAADFGHERAVHIAQVITESFAALGDQLTELKSH